MHGVHCAVRSQERCPSRAGGNHPLSGLLRARFVRWRAETSAHPPPLHLTRPMVPQTALPPWTSCRWRAASRQHSSTSDRASCMSDLGRNDDGQWGVLLNACVCVCVCVCMYVCVCLFVLWWRATSIGVPGDTGVSPFCDGGGKNGCVLVIMLLSYLSHEKKEITTCNGLTNRHGTSTL